MISIENACILVLHFVVGLGDPVPVYECYVCMCVCALVCGLSVYVCRNIGLYSDTK